MQTTSEVKEIIAQAHAQHRPLVITGYRAGDGEVTNFEVNLVGSDGYKKLVHASLHALINNKFMRPAGIPEDVWKTALTEQRASWEGTLAGAHMRKQAEDLQEWPQGYVTKASDPELVIIRNAVWTTRDVVTPSEKVTKSAAKTLAKKAMTAQSPLNHYEGQFNLAPGKFENISLK